MRPIDHHVMPLNILMKMQRNCRARMKPQWNAFLFKSFP